MKTGFPQNPVTHTHTQSGKRPKIHKQLQRETLAQTNTYTLLATQTSSFLQQTLLMSSSLLALQLAVTVELLLKGRMLA